MYLFHGGANGISRVGAFVLKTTQRSCLRSLELSKLGTGGTTSEVDISLPAC